MSHPIPVDYDRFLDCVHCGLCLEACPTYLELGVEADSPRGRIHLMRAVADGRMPLDRGVTRHLDLCLGCRACEPACPSGVRYGLLIEAARSAVEATRRRPLADRLLRQGLVRNVLVSTRRLRAMLLPVAILDRVFPRWRQARIVPRSLRRMLALLPPRIPSPIRQAPPALSSARDAPPSSPIALLRGCVVPVLSPEVLAAADRVLTAAGFQVETPPIECCGALLLHAGDLEGARQAARRTIDACGTAPLTTVAAGCGAMMREYDHLLAGDPAYAERARAFATRARDVTVLLAEAGDRLRLGPLPARAAYHDPCHLAHAQGVRSEPRALLARVPGLELVPLLEGDVCCGSAGSYNLTEPAMADRLLARKVDHVLASGARLLVTGNPGCMLQIAAGLRARGAPVEVKHTVEVLAAALASAPVPASP